MTFLGRFFGLGELQDQMRQRTDLVISEAKRTRTAINSHTRAVRRMIDMGLAPQVKDEFKGGLENLIGALNSLEKALEAQRATLEELIRKIS